MIKHVFITLPVADLQRSTDFFKALGFSNDPQFGGETGSCIIVNDAISVMLLPHARFQDFTPRAICDTSKAAEVLISLRCDTREEVDNLVAKALAAGATTHDEPEDLGFMYSHSFIDLDGHGWGVFHMSGVPPRE